MIDVDVWKEGADDKVDYSAKLINFLYLPERNSEHVPPGIYGMVADEYGDTWLVERDLIVVKMKGQR